ncbi:MAG: outer membrane protein transport protein [Pseudomonadota bacterium]
MKKIALAATTLGLATGVAHAGGLDRSFTPIDPLFEKGNYAELSFGFTMPDVTGSDLLGNSISNVGDDYAQAGAAVKIDFNDKLSMALIYDQPYGADVRYGGNPATTLLGGTRADAETHALTAVVRYKFTERWSAYGGPRFLQAGGGITLSGLAYGPLNGYNVEFSGASGAGYVVGAAYEIPDIALRASLTYHSPIDIELVTTDTLGTPPLVTNTQLPQSYELALQSGINQNTLVFGSIRWADWSVFSLDPPNPFVPNLAQLDDVTTYEIGVGRRFTDKFSASFAVSYEDGGSDDLVSPLAPTNGQTAITIGGKYKINDSVDLSGGVRYTWLGNARPETGTPDTPRGSFTNNNAISVGFKLGYHF